MGRTVASQLTLLYIFVKLTLIIYSNNTNKKAVLSGTQNVVSLNFKSNTFVH